MTKEELHKILDDENKKITVKEFQDILYRLKKDCFEQINVLDNLDPKTQWYYGEVNAFYLALDLSEHIRDDKEECKHKFVTQARYDQLSKRGLLEEDVMYLIVEAWEVE